MPCLPRKDRVGAGTTGSEHCNCNSLQRGYNSVVLHLLSKCKAVCAVFNYSCVETGACMLFHEMLAPISSGEADQWCDSFKPVKDVSAPAGMIGAAAAYTGTLIGNN